MGAARVRASQSGAARDAAAGGGAAAAPRVVSLLIDSYHPATRESLFHVATLRGLVGDPALPWRVTLEPARVARAPPPNASAAGGAAGAGPPADCRRDKFKLMTLACT